MEKEIYYAIHEAIQVMEHYNNGEDFALVSSLRRMHELEQKLQQHSVMQAEGSDVSEGAAVASSAAGQNGSDGVWCKYIRDKRCECEADSECTLI